MYGIENNLELPESINVDLYSADESITGKLPRLPENLEEALRLAEKSDLVRSILNERVIERFVELKTKELKEYDRAEDKYGHFIENYFRVI